MRKWFALVAVAALGLSACTVDAGSTPTTSRTASATGSSTRWIAVSVATLWETPNQTRTIDRFSSTNPVGVRFWVSSLSVSQKSWLVGRLETQALYGTRVLVVATSGAWSKVLVTTQPTPRDRRGYPGWVPTVQLSTRAPTASSTIAVVRSPTAWLYGTASAASGAPKVMELSYDTRLPVVAPSGSFVKVRLPTGRFAYLRSADVVVRVTGQPISSRGGQIVVEARKFLGLAYLWAGTSGYGFDCSGFTYSVLHELGATIPRDAAPQSTVGQSITRTNLRPGDLVFFKDASGSVVHVGIYVGVINSSPAVIHSPATGRPIMITALSAWSTRDYAGARRYLAP